MRENRARKGERERGGAGCEEPGARPGMVGKRVDMGVWCAGAHSGGTVRDRGPITALDVGVPLSPCSVVIGDRARLADSRGESWWFPANCFGGESCTTDLRFDWLMRSLFQDVF